MNTVYKVIEHIDNSSLLFKTVYKKIFNKAYVYCRKSECSLRHQDYMKNEIFVHILHVCVCTYFTCLRVRTQEN